MPLVRVDGPGDWENYHKTGISHLRARYALRSGDAGPGRDDIRQCAEEVRAWLGEARAAGVPVRPVGGAWSPSNIQIVDQGWMLNTRRFNRCFRIAAADLAPGAEIGPEALLLVQAGVQIDEINDRLEGELHRSLRTTGASNGQTLAGACATATHGSVIEAGGIQEHVRAVQIVTPGGICWIEPSAGLMSDDFIAATGASAVRDDEMFAAALVAVGSLGVVTALVIETVPVFLVRPIMRLIDLQHTDIERLAAGDFRGLSRDYGLDADPYFTMLITNPYKPFRRKAVIRFFYKEPFQPGYTPATPAELGAGYDAFSMLNRLLRNFPWARGWLLQTIMKLGVGKGISKDEPPVFGTWGETTETHKPLADLFTAAVFADRNDLVGVFETMCSTFSGGGGSTVVSLRFMKGGPGLLSPARWPDTVGLDCDGPSSPRTIRAWRAMTEALDARGIAFTRHWGKHNELDAARVAKDFGEDFVRWKHVRDRLLPTLQDRRLFAAPVLDRMGLTV
jgi:hypothetical protein